MNGYCLGVAAKIKVVHKEMLFTHCIIPLGVLGAKRNFLKTC